MRYNMPPPGEHLYVNHPNGGYLQAKTESEGIVLDFWSANDDHISTCYVLYSDIHDETCGESFEFPSSEKGSRQIDAPKSGKWLYLDIPGGGEVMVSATNNAICATVFSQQCIDLVSVAASIKQLEGVVDRSRPRH
jgi:hypothetical protein